MPKAVRPGSVVRIRRTDHPTLAMSAIANTSDPSFHIVFMSSRDFVIVVAMVEDDLNGFNTLVLTSQGILGLTRSEHLRVAE